LYKQKLIPFPSAIFLIILLLLSYSNFIPRNLRGGFNDKENFYAGGCLGGLRLSF
jgi:hypothetical protein